MASSLDLSLLSNKLKDYVLTESNTIMTKLLADGLGFQSYFGNRIQGSDEVPMIELVVGSVLQPGGKDDFTPKNNVVQFKNRIGKVRACKVDIQFKHSQIVQMKKSWLSKIKQAALSSNPYDMPLEQEIVNRLIEQAKNDLRLQAVFKGVYNAAGNDPVDTMNGLLTIVKNLIAGPDAFGSQIPAGNISAGAAITNSNAYDEVTKVVDLVFNDPNYAMFANGDFVCLVSPSTKRKYEQDYKATFSAEPYNTSFGKEVLDGTNIQMIPEPGMVGSDRIIITPKANLVWLYDDETGPDSIEVEKEKRNINFMMDFNAAPDFAIAEIIWTNNYAGIV